MISILFGGEGKEENYGYKLVTLLFISNGTGDE
jgi:hypothetical protein